MTEFEKVQLKMLESIDHNAAKTATNTAFIAWLLVLFAFPAIYLIVSFL